MSDCVPHAAASVEFIQLHAQASTPTGDTHLCALPKEFRLDQQPFIQTQLEHAQYKCKYASQQPFLPTQLGQERYKCKYAIQQPFIETQLGHEQDRCK